MEKRREIQIAKKKRAKLLAEHERRGCTIQVIADKHGVSHSRMSLQLKKARAERDRQIQQNPDHK